MKAPPPDDQTPESDVRRAFEDFWHTYLSRGEGVIDHILSRLSPALTVFGTGQDEVIQSREAIVPFLERERREVPAPMAIAFDWIRVQRPAPTVALVTAEAALTAFVEDAALPIHIRLSQLFEYVDGQWLTRHLHGSLPASEQTPGESFPVDALRARNEVLERLVATRTAELEARNRELQAALGELKQAQKQLILSEKMASLGQMTAGIAHEIKNPLNFVNNFAELNIELGDEMLNVLDAGDLDEARAILDDIKQNAAQIVKHGKRADAIVRAMMQHARGGTGEPETVVLNTFVEEYVGLAYHGMRAQSPAFNVDLVTDFDADAGTVKMVPQDIGRVLLNLLSNAFYAVREKETSGTETGYAPEVRIATRRTPEGVEIRVTDNGPGIPAAVREKIFDPFFTTKPTGSGTGLGLSLSYEIVTGGHDGTMTVESTEGRGTTFVVRLPAGT